MIRWIIFSKSGKGYARRLVGVAGSNPAWGAMIADEKAARQKDHEKRTVFHGFLLFMRQKRVFMKSEVKIIF